jgi:hypothetical protein
LGIELRGDLTLEEERFLQNQIDDKQEKTRNLQRASEEGLKKLQSMDEAFTKLKQVSGDVLHQIVLCIHTIIDTIIHHIHHILTNYIYQRRLYLVGYGCEECGRDA